MWSRWKSGRHHTNSSFPLSAGTNETNGFFFVANYCATSSISTTLWFTSHSACLTHTMMLTDWSSSGCCQDWKNYQHQERTILCSFCKLYFQLSPAKNGFLVSYVGTVKVLFLWFNIYMVNCWENMEAIFSGFFP